MVKMFNRNEGFTLIELLVVVAILGILAAVVVPNVANFIGSGETEANETEEKNVRLAVTAVLADAGTTTFTTGVNPASHDISAAGNGAYTMDDYLEGANEMKCAYLIANNGNRVDITQSDCGS